MHSVVFAVLLLPVFSPIDSTDAIQERVRSEGPAAWQSLRIPWSGEYLRKMTTEFGDQKLEIECLIKFGKEGGLLCESTRGGITRIEATNRRYNFSVSRSESDSKYVLDSGSPNIADVNPLRVISRAAVPFRSDSYLMGYPLEEILLDDKQFPWKDASSLDDGAIEIRLTSNSREPMFSGDGAEFSVVLNPKKSWRIESFSLRNFTGQAGRRSDFSVEYLVAEDATSREMVRRVKEKRTIQEQVEWETIEIIDRKDYDVDPGVFTLPFYGIPETAVLPHAPWLNSQWILLGFGVVMLGLGFWLWKKQ